VNADCELSLTVFLLRKNPLGGEYERLFGQDGRGPTKKERVGGFLIGLADSR
jgi:hypothetical protein